MAKNQIYPASIEYLNVISNTVLSLKNNNVENGYLLEEVNELSNLLCDMKKCINKLEDVIKKAQDTRGNAHEVAKVWRDDVLTAMNDLRKVADTIETKVDSKYWPMPTYADLLYGI